jgi:two-component system, chemotaxis family, sensor kinase CheA
MARDDDLGERLRATFVQELDEQVRELNSSLLALEQGQQDGDLIRGLFRSAHTIKGAARVAGVPLVEEACHALESVFADVRDQRRKLDGADYALLFAAIDGLADAGARLRAGTPLDGSALEQLLPRLNTATIGGQARGREPLQPTTRRGDAEGAAAGERASAEAAAPGVPGAPAPEAAAPRPVGDAGAELVRVRADRLDVLLSAVGELIIATGRVVDRLGGRDEDARRLDQITDAVADVVRELRLRPFSDACEALPRAVRDVAAGAGRDVSLQLGGQDVEADRIVVDALREPLLHLVRNAVDHGIEPPQERERLGKPPTGTVEVSAELDGGRLVVSVSDDGSGLDEDAIRAALRDRGRPVPERRAELASALIHGGVSTRRQASAISGRGVGLDLVRAAVERIGGTMDVRWRKGAGTRFLLECPPSPANIRALLVRVGSHVLALPTTHVERLRRLRAADLRSAEGRSVLPSAGGPLEVRSLAALLGPPFEGRPVLDAASAVIVAAGARRAALVVDEVLDETDVVVRPLDVEPGAVRFAAGAAILPDGRIALLLSVGSLLATAVQAGTAIAPVEDGPAAPRQRILVADDSITTRTLEQAVLEAAGYDVVTAVDGEDAWRRLEGEGADAVIADVEMPRMDGFTLCRRIRSSARFAELPIVLVTGLASDADRARGLEAGADAYIVKSNFDHGTLLDVVRQLTAGP